MKAMVLAAGLGTRLGDLTAEVPKPMLDIEGRPMLEYVIAQLRRHGFDELIINLHYHPEMIRACFGDGSRLGVRINWSYEPSLLGTAGGVKNVAAFFNDGDFLVHYGDIVTDEDFSQMLRFHRTHDGLATLLVHERARSNSIIWVGARQRIERFLERPGEEERPGISSPWVHSGVCIARRELLDLIPAGRPADLPRDLYVPLVKEQQPLYAWSLHGYRCAVDSPERLEEVRAAVREGRLDIPLDASTT